LGLSASLGTFLVAPVHYGTYGLVTIFIDVDNETYPTPQQVARAN